MRRYLYFIYESHSKPNVSCIDTFNLNMSEQDILSELYDIYGKDNITAGNFLD